MYGDIEGTFSKDQALTATAVSDNYIDLKNVMNRVGNPLDVYVSIPQALTGGTSVKFALESASDIAFATDKRVEVETEAIVAADLVAGFGFPLTIPKATQRFVRMSYTVSGAFGAGTVNAMIAETSQTNSAEVIAETAKLI